MGACASSPSATTTAPPTPKSLLTRKQLELATVTKLEGLDQNEGDRFCIIWTKWLEDWLSFVCGNEERGAPGEIANWNVVKYIIDNDQGVDMGFVRIGENLEGKYRRVKPEVWDFFAKTYGGGPRICVDRRIGFAYTDWDDLSSWAVDQRWFATDKERKIRLCNDVDDGKRRGGGGGEKEMDKQKTISFIGEEISADEVCVGISGDKLKKGEKEKEREINVFELMGIDDATIKKLNERTGVASDVITLKQETISPKPETTQKTETLRPKQSPVEKVQNQKSRKLSLKGTVHHLSAANYLDDAIEDEFFRKPPGSVARADSLMKFQSESDESDYSESEDEKKDGEGFESDSGGSMGSLTKGDSVSWLFSGEDPSED